MIELLADVGGTNARLALARGGVIDPASLTRYAGDDHAGFDAVLTRYLAEQGLDGPGADGPGADGPEADGPGAAIGGLCVAVAGPVAGGRARLTNRDWRFDAADLARRLGLDPGAGRVRLINDLTALGHALRGLHGAALLPVHAPAAGAADAEGAPPGNGQALVLGLGTGANACAVRDLGQLGALCLEAEAGHAALPAPVMAALAAAVGAGRAAGFDCVEALFSGRGLTRLHACLTGPPEGAAPLSGSRIVGAARGGDAAALETVTLFARMLGLYARDLGLIFLPREGLYLAGSVARGVLTGGGGAAFRAAFAGGVGPFAAIVRAMPVRLIADDMAALAGCLNALRAAV